MKWDGSFLGCYKWDQIILKWHPARDKPRRYHRMPFYADIHFEGEIYTVMFKPNIKKNSDQLIADMLKSSFGIGRMGLHTIELDKCLRKTVPGPWRRWHQACCQPYDKTTSYYICPAMSEQGSFRIATPLSVIDTKDWIRLKGGLDSLRRIYLFKWLIGASNSDLDSVLCTSFGCLSIDEDQIGAATNMNHKVYKQLFEGINVAEYLPYMHIFMAQLNMLTVCFPEHLHMATFIMNRYCHIFGI